LQNESEALPMRRVKTNQTIWFICLLVAMLVYRAETSPARAQWSQETFDYYNPFNLANAPDCPRIPGLFFLIEKAACVTYIPAMGNNDLIRGEPAYRYTVPVQKNAAGENAFEADAGLTDLCTGNPKVHFLQSVLGQRFRVNVLSGTAVVDHPEAAQTLEAGRVCRVEISEGTI
jgi:hypothetical protein